MTLSPTIPFSESTVQRAEEALGGQPIAGDDSSILKQILVLAANLIS